MKIAKKAVVAVFVALFFLVACNPQPGATLPSVSNLSSTQKTTLLTETLFASTYSQTVKVEENGPEYILQNEYSYSYELDGTYKTAYKDAFGNNPTYITAGATLTFSYSIKDGNQHTSLSIEGSSGLSGTIEIATIFNPTTDTYSYSIDGTSFDATGVELPDFDELLGLPKSFFRIQFLIPNTDEVVHTIVLTQGIKDLYKIFLFEYGFSLDDLDIDSLTSQRFIPLPHEDMDQSNIDSFGSNLFMVIATNNDFSLDDFHEMEGHHTMAQLMQLSSDSSAPLSDNDPWFLSVISTEFPDLSYYFAAFEYMSEDGDGVLTFTNVGNPGEIVAGTIAIEKITLYEGPIEDEPPLLGEEPDKDYEVEYGVFDVEIDFKIYRANDYLMPSRKISFMNDDTKILDYFWPEKGILKLDQSIIALLNEENNFEITGFSTEKEGGEHYSVNEGITIPAHDITLYLILEDE